MTSNNTVSFFPPASSKSVEKMGLREVACNDANGQMYAFPYNPSQKEEKAVLEYVNFVYAGNLPTLPWIGLWVRLDAPPVLKVKISFQDLQFHKDKAKIPVSLENIDVAIKTYIKNKIESACALGYI